MSQKNWPTMWINFAVFSNIFSILFHEFFPPSPILSHWGLRYISPDQLHFNMYKLLGFGY